MDLTKKKEEEALQRFLKKCHGREESILKAANQPSAAAKTALEDLYRSWGFEVRIDGVYSHLRALERELGCFSGLAIIFNVTSAPGSSLAGVAKNLKQAFIELFSDEAKRIDRKLLIEATVSEKVNKKLLYQAVEQTSLKNYDVTFRRPAWLLHLVNISYSGKRAKRSVMDRYLSNITSGVP